MTGQHRSRVWLAEIAIGLAVAVFLDTTVAAASGDKLVLVPDWKMPLLILLFVFLMYPANTLIFKPLFRVLDEREEHTAGTRQRAEKIAREAAETLANYERAVRDVREEAELGRKQHAAEARSEQGLLTAEARAVAERQIEQARVELAAALDESRRAMRAQVQSLATEAAARVLGRPL